MSLSHSGDFLLWAHSKIRLAVCVYVHPAEPTRPSCLPLGLLQETISSHMPAVSSSSGEPGVSTTSGPGNPMKIVLPHALALSSY